MIDLETAIPVFTSSHNTRHPEGFIPKNFPTPLLDALDILKRRGIRVECCSSSNIIDGRISEFNIVCSTNQIILPDDIPDTCEYVYVYKVSGHWMASRVDPVYESFTPFIFAKKKRSQSTDIMYNIDNGGDIEVELIYYTLKCNILEKLKEFDLLKYFKSYRASYHCDPYSSASELAKAVCSLSYKRMYKEYYRFQHNMDQYGDIPTFKFEVAPEFKQWLISEIVRVSDVKGRPIKFDDPKAKRISDYLERLCKSL